MAWFLLIVYGVACGAYSLHLVKVKGYSSSATEWFMGGLFLGIFALIAAAGLPVNKIPDDRWLKRCPDCAESIKLAANTCKYCGRKFSAREIITECGHVINKSADCIEAVEIISRFNDESSLPYLEKALSYTNEADYGLQNLGDKAGKALMKIGSISALMVVLRLGRDEQKLEATKALKDMFVNRDKAMAPTEVVNITTELIGIIKGWFNSTAKICSAATLRSIGEVSAISLALEYLEQARKERKLDKDTYNKIISKLREET